jgi:hypothetical protein
MNAEQLFNQKIILDLSFFNFDNAITAAYFANQDLKICRVNENFRAFFPELGSVIDLPMPEVLERMGLPAKQVEQYKTGLAKDGSVLCRTFRSQLMDRIKCFHSCRHIRRTEIFRTSMVYRVSLWTEQQNGC